MSPRGLVRRCRGEPKGAIRRRVERLAEQAALVLDDADHRVRHAADPQLAADRVEALEEVARDFVADHDHRRAELRFLLREDAAVGEVELLDREVVALDGMRLDLPRPRVLAAWRADVVLALDGVARPGGQRARG